MPNFETIKSYLVELGYDIDHVTQRKFDEALKRTGIAVTNFAKSAVGDFAVVGTTFAGVVAAVTGATVGLMGSVAKQDLGYQVLARRLFMTTEAARKMKVATDALGYSLEEIIWGPPELQERYRQLIQDQTRMFELLGGDRGEKAMRTVRDIGFQFTRMGPALQIFAIRLTEDILNKLTGSPESLEVRLKNLVDWFESPDGFVKISDRLSSTIVPVLKALGNAAERLFTPKNVDWAVNMIVKATDAAGRAIDLAQNPGILGSLYDKSKSFSQNLSELTGTVREDMKGRALAAVPPGLGPTQAAEFLALIQQESGFNPSAVGPLVPGEGQAFGLGQIMPGNVPKGMDVTDPDQNLAIASKMFFGALARHHGDAREALHDYYGRGKPIAGQPTFDEYFNQWQQKFNQWMQDPWMRKGGSDEFLPHSYDPTAYKSPSITINVQKSNASAQDIAQAVDQVLRQQHARVGVQMAGGYS